MKDVPTEAAAQMKGEIYDLGDNFVKCIKDYDVSCFFFTIRKQKVGSRA